VVAVGLLLLAVPATSTAAPVATYVALGDSYTAGPGIPTQLSDPPGCQRSDHDYPHLVAAALGLALRDVSCSGAGTRDLTSPQAVSGGPNPPQLDALDAATTVVTLQIGGNDIGFAELVAGCISLLPIGAPCTVQYTSGGGDEISRRIAATGPRVAATLAQIHRRAPGARIYVVGYPSILPGAGVGCWPVLPFTFGDVPWLRAKQAELNAMLAARAAAGGATYVDTPAASTGHDACQLPGVRWIEPLVPLSPAAPVHPNGLGMEGVAAKVQAAIGTP